MTTVPMLMCEDPDRLHMPRGSLLTTPRIRDGIRHGILPTGPLQAVVRALRESRTTTRQTIERRDAPEISTGAVVASARVRGCAVGAIGAAAAAIVWAGLAPWLGASAPLLIFPAVITLAAWTGGVWAGLFTTAFSGALGLVLLGGPLEVIDSDHLNRTVLLLLFGAEGTLIAVLTGNLRSQQRALAAALAAEQMFRSRAEGANRLKHEFLEIVSHELRTPLTVILGSLWKLKLTPDSVGRRAVDVIERNSHALVRTVDNLIYVSQTLSGHRPLNLQLVDVVALCDVAINTLRNEAARHHVELQFHAQDSTAFVDGDPDLLHQALVALIANAIKFSGKGTRVEVSLARGPSQTQVVVTGTGTGMSPALLEYLFQTFWQADSPAARSRGGVGLEFTAARRIAALHGGAVLADREGLGNGARFTLTLPGRSVESIATPVEACRPSELDHDFLGLVG